MATPEEIKKVLTENPWILVDVLTARPEIIYQALAKLTPWQNLATKSDLESLRNEINEKLSKLEERVKTVEERMATKEELAKLEKRVEDIETRMATKDELKKLEEKMATKDELKRLEERMATKDDLAKLEMKLNASISAIGSRWGVKNEDTFRQGIVELLKDAGYEAKRELLYDKDGHVYGEPSEVEVDVVLKDGKVILVEITSAYKRTDTDTILRKKELYESLKGVKVDEVMAITAYIDDKDPDRVKARAQSLGIKIVTPFEIE